MQKMSRTLWRPVASSLSRAGPFPTFSLHYELIILGLHLVEEVCFACLSMEGLEDIVENISSG